MHSEVLSLTTQTAHLATVIKVGTSRSRCLTVTPLMPAQLLWGLIQIILLCAFRNYRIVMALTVLRLLTLVALMLMPFGMGAAPAMAQQVSTAQATTSMDHCDKQSDENGAPAPQQTDCAVMCIAISSAANPTPPPLLQPVAPRSIALATLFVGVEPDIATPPPKIA